jgi:hypothetical protein
VFFLLRLTYSPFIWPNRPAAHFNGEILFTTMRLRGSAIALMRLRGSAIALMRLRGSAIALMRLRGSAIEGPHSMSGTPPIQHEADHSKAGFPAIHSNSRHHRCI